MKYLAYVMAATLWLHFHPWDLAVAAEPQQHIPGIGPAGNIAKVHGGFKFTEGPAADGKGNLYFSDVGSDRVHKVAEDGALSVFLDPSHRTNGLMFGKAGRLIASQSGKGRIVSFDVDTKQLTPVAETYQGARFNSPNDLVVDRQGGVYFTDPQYGSPKPLPQGTEAVYYVAPGGEVTRLIDNLLAPNGVILSPDEKTLYVVPGTKDVMAYTVSEPGKLENGRAFFTLGGGGDGLTVDTNGNLYITSSKGPDPSKGRIQVVSPEGIRLGIIEIPEKPCNVTFGGKDMRTLFVTAQTSLYSVEMEATGHRFGSWSPE